MTTSQASTDESQIEPLFYFAELRGTQAVGLRVVEQYDFSRVYRFRTDALGKSYIGERSRPLQTLIWYPAEYSDSLNMTVRDYCNLWVTETGFGQEKMMSRAADALRAMRGTFATRMWALRDAVPAPGRYPVVIYAPSFSAPAWENADLCEYLASHGYVVIATPSLGAKTRDMTRDLAGINAQARDISFLIGSAHTFKNAETSRIAVVGFSWGGIANLFAAARDNRIRALVALDGGLRYYPGLVKRAGDVYPEEMTIPLLSFAQHDFPLEYQFRDLSEVERDGPSVLAAWRGDLVMVHMLRLFHAELSSMNQRNEDMWWKIFHVWSMLKADYGRQDGITGYAWMARYTLQFLNAYLKQDMGALSFLDKTPAENGVPKHVMAVSYRTGTGRPVSFNGFRLEVGRIGFEHLAEVYGVFGKERSGFNLDEATLCGWAEELIEASELTKAIMLLRWNLQLHPDSTVAHGSLAAAYEKSGERQLAREHYREALNRYPENADARIKLRELEP